MAFLEFTTYLWGIEIDNLFKQLQGNQDLLLTMRNWNKDSELISAEEYEIYYLPMRNWNFCLLGNKYSQWFYLLLTYEELKYLKEIKDDKEN